MNIFLTSLVVALVQSCVAVKPGPEKLQSDFVIANAIDESNSTSLEDFRRLMNFVPENFEFPKLLASSIFSVQAMIVFSGPGFCDGEIGYEQVIMTVEGTSAFEAIFYGCSMQTGKDVQIIVLDKETHIRRGNRKRIEGINRDLNYAFCTCGRMKKDVNKWHQLDSVDKIFRNKIVLLIVMLGVGFLLLLSWLHDTIFDRSDN